MAGSQLKRLKASLHEKGVIGPQQSKKQKKKNALERRENGGQRPNKAAALGEIRESFNPFDLKHSVRGPKFEVTTNRPANAKGIHGRPTDARTLGEERRRETLLVEMNRRNKSGGILDRRFGEGDQNLTPEQKMLERFVREKQQSRSQKKGSLFDLEDDDQPIDSLTHMGKSLSFNGPELVDDFEEEDIGSGSDEDAFGEERRELRALKRMRGLDGGEEEEGPAEGQPERKKTKKEIYEEIIAKSKAHKAERQQTKDDDEDLRDEIDQQLPELHSLLFQNPRNSKSSAPVAAADSAEAQREKLERDYDLRLKQLAQDRRAQPDQRTKTEEEKAQDESERLQELEQKRQRRMQGQNEDSSDEEDEKDGNNEDTEMGDDQPLFQDNYDDDEFDLGKGISKKGGVSQSRPEGVDDEDDFLIDDDLIASGSDLEPVSDDSEDESAGEESQDEDDDEFTKGLLSELEARNPVFTLDTTTQPEDDDEFTKGLLSELEARNPVFTLDTTTQPEDPKEDAQGLPYTFSCPQTHQELVSIMENIPVDQLPVVIQRIRALYHPKLDSGHKAKMAEFSKVLVQHLAYLATLPKLPSFATIESLTRHIHSLAKTYPVEIANEFRAHIEAAAGERPTSPSLGDLVILTAVDTVFPTSDYWHQVVTPSMLVISRWLEQIPKKVVHYSRGVFLCTLALQYQRVSKRYVPEVISAVCNTLCALAPTKPSSKIGFFPMHEPVQGIRTRRAASQPVRKLTPNDCVDDSPSDEGTKVAILATGISVAEAAADLWSGHSAFTETFEPVVKILAHLCSKPCQAELPAALGERVVKIKAKLERMLRIAHMARRPLELHHHKPLAIKMAIPKFEDQFDPNKHYDPDRDRAELSKLKKEHKKERKGAMRELRRDANFMAREKLRVKKVKDAAYEKKYKRLVAEIQGEEGRASNEYEREKQIRKRAAKR